MKRRVKVVIIDPFYSLCWIHLCMDGALSVSSVSCYLRI